MDPSVCFYHCTWHGQAFAARYSPCLSELKFTFRLKCHKMLNAYFTFTLRALLLNLSSSHPKRAAALCGLHKCSCWPLFLMCRPQNLSRSCLVINDSLCTDLLGCDICRWMCRGWQSNNRWRCRAWLQTAQAAPTASHMSQAAALLDPKAGDLRR